MPSYSAGLSPARPASTVFHLDVSGTLVGLETAKPGDATPRMVEWLADPAAMDGLNAAVNLPGVDELRRYFASFDNNRRNLAIVRLLPKRQTVGLIMFDIDPRHLTASFHLLIGELAARTGLAAVEAVDLLLSHLFGKRRVEKVVIEPLARNRAAVRLCERMGLRREGELKAHRRDARSGERLDQLIFGITRREHDEWRAEKLDRLAALAPRIDRPDRP